MPEIKLIPLEPSDRENFIKDNQYAFKYGALEEFGERDDHLDNDGEIISGKTIGKCIDEGTAYRITCDGRIVGGLVLKIDPETNVNHLELLFVSPDEHSKGIGYAAWKEVERLYPQTGVWETYTPYFEKRNIHFYINKCGFSAVEFFNEKHVDKNQPIADAEGPDEMFRFIKIMKAQEL
ncbi:MAG: GNAT family N-acetyltransferase [Clostridia bacterium]|nr:GNAT family N-acetyltransferase [Clostridia bacterium]